MAEERRCSEGDTGVSGALCALVHMLSDGTLENVRRTQCWGLGFTL